MKTISVSPPYAIIFIYDPSNKNANTPEYINGRIISTNGDCISIATQAEVDGDVDITLDESDTRNPVGLSLMFHGKLSTPGKKIVISTALHQSLLEIDVLQKTSKLKIWTDDDINATQIHISIT
jgi:hypothetical protein